MAATVSEGSGMHRMDLVTAGWQVGTDLVEGGKRNYFNEGRPRECEAISSKR